MALSLLVCCSSCVSYQEFRDFTEGPEFPATPVAITNLPQATIQIDDELLIRVYSGSAETSAPYNLEQLASERGGNQSTFLVDAAGMVELPNLGQIKLQGLTTLQAREKIRGMLSEDLVDPVIQVRFTNFRITLYGEVNSPGTYTLPDERFSVLEALSMAGYVTDFANRSTIQIIREKDGERIFGTVDLRSRDIFSSPFFYLQQNDIIYVEPDKYKATALRDPVNRIFPYISLVTSIATLVIAVSRF